MMIRLLLAVPLCISVLIAICSFIYFFLSLFLFLVDNKALYTKEELEDEEEITIFELSLKSQAAL